MANNEADRKGNAKKKFMAELEAAGEKATQIEIINRSGLYCNFHKRLGERFLSDWIRSISVKEANKGIYFIEPIFSSNFL